MLPVGMLLTWAGYSISLWGWCLLRGYDVTLGQLMSPMHPYGSNKGEVWPPKPIGADVIWPGGRAKAAPAPPASSSGPAGIPAQTGTTGSEVKPWG